MAGVASLFTREFFEAARARLKPGGLLCQWAHTYDISPQDLRSIVADVRDRCFRRARSGWSAEAILLLIGARDGEILPRLADVEPASRERPRPPRRWSTSASPRERRRSRCCRSLPAVRASWSGTAPARLIQTDDRTALEYSAPRGIYGRSREDNARGASAALAADQPPAVRDAFDRGDRRRPGRPAGLMDLEGAGLRARPTTRSGRR